MRLNEKGWRVGRKKPLTREFFDSATLIDETSLGKPRSEPLLLLLANFKIHRKLNIFEETWKKLILEFETLSI